MEYQQLLLDELSTRQRRNPQYSLRAFARDMGVSVSAVSEILTHKKGLSGARAMMIGCRLNWSEGEIRYFTALVETAHARSQATKARAAATLAALKADREFDEMTIEHFKLISDWLPLAILESLEISSGKYEPAEIARRFGATSQDVEDAVERLKRIGLLQLEEDGRMMPTTSHSATPQAGTVRHIQNYHREILKKADEALTRVDVTEREFAALTMAIDSSRIEEAKHWLREFRRKFAVDVQRDGAKDRVYCLGKQFFPLDIKDSGGLV